MIVLQILFALMGLFLVYSGFKRNSDDNNGRTEMNDDERTQSMLMVIAGLLFWGLV